MILHWYVVYSCVSLFRGYAVLCCLKTRCYVVLGCVDLWPSVAVLHCVALW